MSKSKDIYSCGPSFNKNKSEELIELLKPDASMETVEAVKKLLNNNADPNVKSHGFPAVYQAAAALWNNSELCEKVLRLLVEHNANINEAVNEYGDNTLKHLVFYKDVRETLLRLGADPDQKSYYGFSARDINSQAFSFNSLSLEEVKKAIELFKHDINYQYPVEIDPNREMININLPLLGIAFIHNNLEVVDYLLKHNADVNQLLVKKIEGYSLLELVQDDSSCKEVVQAVNDYLAITETAIDQKVELTGEITDYPQGDE